MIEFTQYVLPNGRKKTTGIERPAEIEAAAAALVALGYRFESEILTTGMVSLTVVSPDADDEGHDVAIVLAKNGPEVPEAVDRLVRKVHGKIVVAKQINEAVDLLGSLLPLALHEEHEAALERAREALAEMRAALPKAPG